MTLTIKQQALLDFIEHYQLEHGSSPTVREMREHSKVRSDNSVLKLLKALADKGYIHKDDTPRGIKLLDGIKKRFESIEQIVVLPLVGHIPAGNPATIEEYAIDKIPVTINLVKNPRASYLLKVKGDSMNDAGIFDGDVVVVSKDLEPKIGDIVVALIDGENTLKRLVKKEGKFFLKPENKAFNELYPLESLMAQGVITGLFRQY